MSEPLRCTECGAQAEMKAKCRCGKGCARVAAGKAAALAIAAHPDWSDPKLAEWCGVGESTIYRARPTSSNEEVEKRVGRDGKKRKSKYGRKVEDAAACMYLDQVMTHAEVCAQTGMSDTVLRKAISRVEGAREQAAKQAEGTLGCSGTTESSVTAPAAPTPAQKQQKSEAAAAKAYQRELDAKYEQRVRDDINRRLEQLVMPRLREREARADRAEKARKGVFKLKEYNAILFCVHPDRPHPSVEEKNEATRLLHEKRLELLSEKEDPQVRTSSLPTPEEFMRGYPWKAKA